MTHKLLLHMIGNPRHPWSTWNRQRLFFAVKDVAFPEDEAYRVSNYSIEFIFFTIF